MDCPKILRSMANEMVDSRWGNAPSLQGKLISMAAQMRDCALYLEKAFGAMPKVECPKCPTCGAGIVTGNVFDPAVFRANELVRDVLICNFCGTLFSPLTA